MKKLVSIAISALLVFMLSPLPALADPDSGAGFEAAVNEAAYEPDEAAGPDGVKAEGELRGAEVAVSDEGASVDAVEGEGPAASMEAGQAAEPGSSEAASAASAASAFLAASVDILGTQDGESALSTQAEDLEWTDESCDVRYRYSTRYSDLGLEAVLNEVDVMSAQPDASIDLVIPSSIEGAKVVAIDPSPYGSLVPASYDSYNKALRSVAIPASVSSISSGAFEDQYSFLNIREVAFAPESPITEIPEHCFYGMNIESVTLPDSIESIGEGAFLNCSKLASIDLPSAKLRTIGASAFQYCTSLASVTVPEGVVSVGESAFMMRTVEGDETEVLKKEYVSESSLRSVVLPNSLETIGRRAFCGSAPLTSVTFGTGMADARLQTIGAEAFAGDSLASVEIPDGVTSIGDSAFDWMPIKPDGMAWNYSMLREGPGSLASVKLGSSQEASQLQTIGANAFRDASITSIALPNTLESLNYDVEKFTTPFEGCMQLQTIEWPTARTSYGFTSVGGFWNCPSISNETVNSIPSWITVIDDFAFAQTTLGDDTSAFALTDIVIPSGVVTIGERAFDMNPRLSSVSLPATVTSIGSEAFSACDLREISIEDGESPLSIGDFAFANNADFLDGEIVLPERVTYLGSWTFDDLGTNLDGRDGNGNVYYLYNKDIKFKIYDEAYADDNPSDPWGGFGYDAVVYYPNDAAADSDIMKLKARYEPTSAYGDPSLVFMPFDPGAFEVRHVVSGTVPAGAAVTLYVDGAAQVAALANGSFATTAVEGSAVGAVVSMDGYVDYAVSPVDGQEFALLEDDWSFTVTLDDMTPLSSTGTLYVALDKEDPDATVDDTWGGNVAVLDASGKVVAQGSVPSAALFCAEGLAPGAYTAVGFDKNDYFSTVSGIADFAAFGLSEADYGTAPATVAAGRSTTVTVTVPDMDVSKLSGVVAEGGVFLTNACVVPGSTFYAQVTYAMAEGRTADALQMGVPEGLEVVSVNSKASAYDFEYDADAHVLSVPSLNAADRQSSTLYVGLVAKAGTYSITASVASGNAIAPVGSAAIDVFELKLDVPNPYLSSREFEVAVHAAAGSEVRFAVGNTQLGTTTITDKRGLAKATLRIPDEEIYDFDLYKVVAMTGPEDDPVRADAAVWYSQTEADTTSVHELSFKHAGETVYLIKDGKDISGGYYTCVVVPSVHPDIYSHTWPFTAVVSSSVALNDTATLRLRMLDGHTRHVVMALDGTEKVSDDITRYTYKVDVEIGDGDIEHNLTEADIPCAFDVIYTMAGKEPVTSISDQKMVDAFKYGYALRGSSSWEQKSANFVSDYPSGLSTPHVDAFAAQADPEDLAYAMFGARYRHENWDVPDPDAVWASLSAEQQQAYLAFEADIDKLAELFSKLWGLSKPVYAYSSAEDFAKQGLQELLGYQTGQIPPDPGSLEQEGYLVIRDGDTDSVAGAGTPTASGQIVAPAWYAVQTDFAEVGEAPSTDDAMLSTQGESLGAEVSLSTQEDPSSGGASFWDGNGNCFGLTDIAKLIWPDGHEQAGDTARTIGDTIVDVDGRLSIVQDLGIPNQILQLNPNMQGVKVVKGMRGASTFTSVAGGAYGLWKAGDDMRRSGIYESENQRLKAQADYIHMMERRLVEKDIMLRVSPCFRALQAEEEALWKYSEATSKAGLGYQCSAVGTGIVSGFGFVLSRVPGGGTFTYGAGKTWDAFSGAMGLDVLKDIERLRQDYLDARAKRIEQCKGTPIDNPALMKDPFMDPSGYTFEGVESDRVAGVKAVIYRLLDGEWKTWDEAPEYDQETSQTTTSAGLYAWDVPAGSWKVLFSKEGYDDVWSKIMDVPPEWTNVAINMLRSAAPAVSGSDVAEDYSYIDFSFDQYMNMGVTPSVMVGGEPVVDAFWLDSTDGRDENGEAASLSRTLRVPLSGRVAPGVTTNVAVLFAQGYAGKSLPEPFNAYVTPPGDDPLPPDEVGTYYYVEPASIPTYTKGSGGELRFTFKRTEDDEKTYDQFRYLALGFAGDEDSWVYPDPSYYTTSKGSVTVTLSSRFLEELNVREYMIAAGFADSPDFATWPRATFKLVEASDEPGDSDEGGNEGKGDEGGSGGGGTPDADNPSGSGDSSGGKAADGSSSGGESAKAADGGSSGKAAGGAAKSSAKKAASSGKGSPATGDQNLVFGMALAGLALLAAVALVVSFAITRARRRG